MFSKNENNTKTTWRDEKKKEEDSNDANDIEKIYLCTTDRTRLRLHHTAKGAIVQVF